MLSKLKKITSLQIILFSAFIVLVIFCGKPAAEYMADKSAVADGSLKQSIHSFEDFELIGLISTSNGVVATDTDPQLVMHTAGKLTDIKFCMDSIYAPGDIVVYYMSGDDTVFTEKKRVWAVPAQGRENLYEIDLPLTEVTSLRIDPTVYRGNRLYFGDFIFNSEKTVADYFDISAGTVFYFSIYTALFAAILKFIQDLLTKNAE